MKKMRFITMIVLVAVTALGWISFVMNNGSQLVQYKNNIKTADEWVEEGLYQRAILKYKQAITYKSTEENWKKMLTAYEKRYAEDSRILDEYMSSLEEAISHYPDNVAFIKKLANFYWELGDYDLMYECLQDAEVNGVNDKAIKELKQKVKYSYAINYDEYLEVKPMSGMSYAFYNGEFWGAVDAEGEIVLDDVCQYASSENSEGIRVYTLDIGSRLLAADYMVLGIFPFEVTEAGVFSEDLVAVKKNESYNYYDSFAKEQFGGFEEAGAFQNKKAVVRKKGKDFFINKEGKKTGKEYADIVVDGNGYYTAGEVIVAAEKEGQYCLYSEKLKKVKGFTADKIDICTSDNVMAFEENEKWGFVDSEGKVIIKPEYEDAKSFSNGLAAVCKDGKWGFINYQNEVVIDYQFADAAYFNNGGSCMVRTDAANVEDGIIWQLLILNLGITEE